MINHCHGKGNIWSVGSNPEPQLVLGREWGYDHFHPFPHYLAAVRLKSGWWFQSLWKILANWDDYSQYMDKKNVPNHQPINCFQVTPQRTTAHVQCTSPHTTTASAALVALEVARATSAPCPRGSRRAEGSSLKRCAVMARISSYKSANHPIYCQL